VHRLGHPLPKLVRREQLGIGAETKHARDGMPDGHDDTDPAIGVLRARAEPVPDP
jgi:hypothetical protein